MILGFYRFCNTSNEILSHFASSPVHSFAFLFVVVVIKSSTSFNLGCLADLRAVIDIKQNTNTAGKAIEYKN